jgi:RNA polymerase sigma factor (sigma-70 family)
LGRSAECQKIALGGVLSVNGDDTSEIGVLKLEEEPGQGLVASRARFDALFDHFYAELFGLVYRVLGDDRMETEDILQEAFLRLSEEVALQSHADAEIGAWLRRVCLNLAFNQLRSARRARTRLERVGRLEQSIDAEPIGPSALILRQEERTAVRTALAQLSRSQRECLLLRHSGYSYVEIAATLGVAVGSVGVLLARAEHAFRGHYRRQNT